MQMFRVLAGDWEWVAKVNQPQEVIRWQRARCICSDKTCPVTLMGRKDSDSSCFGEIESELFVVRCRPQRGGSQADGLALGGPRCELIPRMNPY